VETNIKIIDSTTIIKKRPKLTWRKDKELLHHTPKTSAKAAIAVPLIIPTLPLITSETATKMTIVTAIKERDTKDFLNSPQKVDRPLLVTFSL